MTEVLPTWRCGRVIADGGVRDGRAVTAAQVGHVACVKQCNVAIEANRKEVRLAEGKGYRVSLKLTHVIRDLVMKSHNCLLG